MTIHVTEAQKTNFLSLVDKLQERLAKSTDKVNALEGLVATGEQIAGPAPDRVKEPLGRMRDGLDKNRETVRLFERIAAQLTTEPETDSPSPAAEERGAMTLDRIRGIADRCTTTGLDVELRQLAEGATLLRLVGVRWDDDVDAQAPQRGRWLYVSTHATESEVVQTLWLAVQLFELHELREEFQFDGVPIFHPHHNLAKLRGFVSGTQRDAREPMPKDNAAAAAELDTPATPPNAAAPAGDAEPSDADDELAKAIGGAMDRLLKVMMSNADKAKEPRVCADGSAVFECPCGEGWVARKPNGRLLIGHHPTAEAAVAELGYHGFGPAAGAPITEAAKS